MVATMSADEYIKLIAAGGDKLQLRPAAAAEIMAVEDELRRALPGQYAHFLSRIGCGGEGPGRGRWLHLDLSLSGNLLEQRTQLKQMFKDHRCGGGCTQGCPRRLLPVYEAQDGTLYGFLVYGGARDGGFESDVHALKRESYSLTRVAPDFASFLDLLGAPLEAKDPTTTAAYS
jgi:hypothetical protein